MHFSCRFLHAFFFFQPSCWVVGLKGIWTIKKWKENFRSRFLPSPTRRRSVVVGACNLLKANKFLMLTNVENVSRKLPGKLWSWLFTPAVFSPFLIQGCLPQFAALTEQIERKTLGWGIIFQAHPKVSDPVLSVDYSIDLIVCLRTCQHFRESMAQTIMQGNKVQQIGRNDKSLKIILNKHWAMEKFYIRNLKTF